MKEAARTRSGEKKCEIQTKCPDLKGSAENITSLLIKFSAGVFSDLKGECGEYHESFDQVSSRSF